MAATATPELEFRGHHHLRATERRLRRTLFAPPSKLTVTQWAERFRFLSREASAAHGKFRISRAPFQKGILDAASDPNIEKVVVMANAQWGKTETILNIIGYFIDQDPCPIMVVMPTVDAGKGWSEERLAPMLRDCPCFHGKVKPPKSRDAGNKILNKKFPGGYIHIAGSNSAASLASRPIRVVLFDEVDKAPASAGTEGDPVNLAVERTNTFWNRKVYLSSTPNIKGKSRIEDEYNKSDMRKFFMPCPHCGHKQTFCFWDVDPATGKDRNRIVFERDEQKNLIEDSVAFMCEECAVLIDESYKMGMLQRGEWIAERPDRKVAGFHLNALYSPWLRWAEVVQKFLDSKGNPEQLKTFWNSSLGLPFEDKTEKIDGHFLAKRLENYGAEVPMGVGVLTAAIDTQDDRLELQITGWGEGEESWVISHDRFNGDPNNSDVWNRAEVALSRVYQHESGAPMRVSACGVDTRGHRTDAAYRFCKPRQHRGIFAAGGHTRPDQPLLGRPSTSNKANVKLYMVGTDTAKDVLFSRMRIHEPGPGFMHLTNALDTEYLLQMTSETVKTKHVNGRKVRYYHKTRDRNEALDLWVLSFAALEFLGGSVRRNLKAYVSKIQLEGRRLVETGKANAWRDAMLATPDTSRTRRVRSTGI